LKQFNLTVKLHLQQLFRSIIYVDLQKHLPDIGQQLRSDFAQYESVHWTETAVRCSVFVLCLSPGDTM